jgi:hypothetical protein
MGNLIYGPAVFQFTSEKGKAYKKALAWFEKYKNDTLEDD